ncbi:head GIN domain-containing protein [Sphingomonas adhaesiva]|uniref:head GIN domain-containing protein n=1 Tax=Sphingomonas adhaesiva TaxID=28212 RepID=UPI002FF49A9B
MRTVVMAALLPLAACGNSIDIGSGDGTSIPAQGSGTTRTFAAADFDRIELRGSDDVVVRVGPGFSVRAEGTPAILDRLAITRDGRTLKVGRQKGVYREGQVRVFVTLPAIAAVGVAGSGNMSVDRVGGRAFDASVAGSGNLALPSLRVERAQLSIAGSGDVTAAGEARTLKVDVAGSGNLSARRFVANGADVNVVGSGNVVATVRGQARVTSMGSGDVDLGAAARCSVTKMGSGEVRCGG